MFEIDTVRRDVPVLEILIETHGRLKCLGKVDHTADVPTCDVLIKV